MDEWIKVDPDEKPRVICDLLWADGSILKSVPVDWNLDVWQDCVAQSDYYDHVTHWRPSK